MQLLSNTMIHTFLIFVKAQERTSAIGNARKRQCLERLRCEPLLLRAAAWNRFSKQLYGFSIMSQLRLEKDDLDNVPVIPLPAGCVLRTYREGDEDAIARSYRASALGDEATAETVRDTLVRQACFKPERVFLIECAGEPAGTAAAWLDDTCAGAGYLHMVGVMPEQRGKRLGAILTVAAIRYSREEGFTRQQLATDDWREGALRLYLGLGYRPLHLDETHPARWKAIAEKLGRPEILLRAKSAI